MSPLSALERFRAIKPIIDQTLTVAAAAAQLGISRKTLYAWLERYHEHGMDGLKTRSSAPKETPHAVDAALVASIVALRVERRTWGPKKLKKTLTTLYPETRWPALSTFGALLRRHGLVKAPRRRRGRVTEPRATFQPATEANDTWCMDFKGHFPLGAGGRCHPLTAQDMVSRYLLIAEGLIGERDALVWPVMERTFREYGLPKTIRHDNGTPFASNGPGGLSRLSIRFIKLGIVVERTDVASPSQNGRLERMHRTLKAEAATPPKNSMREQRRALVDFRRIFNHERPHEALELETPASLYHPSPRIYPGHVPEMTYGADVVVRRLYPQGTMKWRGALIFVGAALGGQLVGLRAIADGLHEMIFGNVSLGVLDEERPKAGLIRHRAG